jgi:hypothetical protein
VSQIQLFMLRTCAIYENNPKLFSKLDGQSVLVGRKMNVDKFI